VIRASIPPPVPRRDDLDIYARIFQRSRRYIHQGTGADLPIAALTTRAVQTSVEATPAPRVSSRCGEVGNKYTITIDLECAERR
jgi:hypothetical protein